MVEVYVWYASPSELAHFHIHNAFSVAAHHNALVFGLAFVNALDNEGEVVDFLSLDGFVFIVFPGSGKRETRVVHFAGVFREVITQNIVDAPERIGASLGQFTGPELYLFAEKQHFLVLATHLREEGIAAA